MVADEVFSCGHFTKWILLTKELYVSNYVLVATLVLLSVPSAVLNALVFIVIWQNPSLQTPSNIFLTNLAISDLAVAAVASPLMVTWKLLEIGDTTSNSTCKVAYVGGLITSAFGSFSFFTVTAATVDRHLALRLHLSYTSVVTTRKVVITCGVLLVSSLVLSSLTLIGVTEFTIGVLSSSFVCVFIMNYCYYKIYSVFRHHHTQIQSYQLGASHPESSIPNLRRFRKTVINLLYVLGLYLFLYLPFICAALTREILGDTMFTLSFMNISIAIAFLNSFVNPLVYCWRIKEFRVGIKAILPLRDVFLRMRQCCRVEKKEKIAGLNITGKSFVV
ncbi:adenosine receptor A3-like [Actinia tenebrosa]|uniref:Adenosine receptor A3-like n=1 Tax=Actinia tenebrosa TaxID=6105 RepID=A0A6P8IU88_ACTTE|nr:adenosine receptor A3-like [Actinia tenebrosa]